MFSKNFDYTKYLLGQAGKLPHFPSTIPSHFALRSVLISFYSDSFCFFLKFFNRSLFFFILSSIQKDFVAGYNASLMDKRQEKGKFTNCIFMKNSESVFMRSDNPSNPEKSKNSFSTVFHSKKNNGAKPFVPFGQVDLQFMGRTEKSNALPSFLSLLKRKQTSSRPPQTQTTKGQPLQPLLLGISVVPPKFGSKGRNPKLNVARFCPKGPWTPQFSHKASPSPFPRS